MVSDDVTIVRLTLGDEARVQAAGHLFDRPPEPTATARFFAQAGHHLLLAYIGDEPAGFVSGVEVTHPDKGTEMFLNELGVDEKFRGRGVGKALVRALAEQARANDCRGMWVLTDEDNVAAKATYRAGGATREQPTVMLDWKFAEHDDDDDDAD